MALKQISLSIPENLFKATKAYSKDFGYKNMQELLLDLLRKRIILENIRRYEDIEKRMKPKKTKRFNQKEAIAFIKGL
ncbi:MAG: hypothetical protein GXP63_01570 [DPANN group archaeon]|nr:hypothetical protein [DPANN group archaeon]